MNIHRIKQSNIFIGGCIFVLLFGVFACNPKGSKSSRNSINAFYYWRTTWNLDVKETDSVFKEYDVKKVYLHLFDVAYSKYSDNNYPTQTVNFGGISGAFLFDSVEVIPTIFITNEVFKNIEDSEVVNLAAKVNKRFYMEINTMAYTAAYDRYEYIWGEPNPYQMKSKKFDELARKDSVRKRFLSKIKEIQFDCDWTESTREKYFQFLNLMKKHFRDVEISSTIRLYQYKYPEKAGVPPVKKGMLMCYNAGDISEPNGTNSIFNKKEILSYITRKEPYPLLLDYAFPIFEWNAVYRDGKLVNLLPAMDFSYGPFQADSSEGDGRVFYTVQDDENLQYTAYGEYLKAGDIIKTERPNLDDVAAVAAKLAKLNTNPSPVVSIFHYDINYIYKNEKAIHQIYNSF